MKKIISFCLIAFFTISLFGCNLFKKEYKLEIKAEKTTIEVEGQLQLLAETDLKNPKFEWSSSNNDIATVDNDGLVTAVAVGKAEITVKVENVGEKKIEITIVAKPELTLTAIKTTLEVEEKLQLVAETTLQNAVYVWTSNNEKIATVDKNGLVTAVAVGKVEITVKVENVGEKKVELTIVAKPNLTLTAKKTTLLIDETLQLEAESELQDSVFEWTSSDSNIATVDDNGLVTALAAGTVEITVKVENVGEKKVELTILKKPEIILKADKTTLEINQTLQLVVEIDYENPVLEWSSSDTTIATVDANGLVTALAAGTVEITVKAALIGEKKIELTVPFPINQLRTLLSSRLSEYSSAKNFGIKIVSNDGANELVSEVILNKTDEGNIESLMFKLSGAENSHVYVKDGFSYILKDETKSKSELTTIEQAILLNNYKFDKLVEVVSAYYRETEFYNALHYVSKDGNVVEFALDLAAYNGNVFVTEGKDAINIKVHLEDGKPVKVETLVLVGETVKSTTLEFNGTTKQTITYPTDLDSYILN